MPLYAIKCSVCDFEGTIFRRVAERDELPTCDCGASVSRIISAPMVQPDIVPYQSPNGGQWVNSRAQRRDDLARSNAIEWEPGIDRDIARNRRSEQEKAFRPIADAVDRIVTEMAVTGKLETTNA